MSIPDCPVKSFPVLLDGELIISFCDKLTTKNLSKITEILSTAQLVNSF